MNKAWIVVSLSVLLLAACNGARTRPASAAARPVPVAHQAGNFSSSQLALGRRLFEADCAPCHGALAQGHPGWQDSGDGIFTAAAPPLNGQGNVSMRSRQQIIDIIDHGERVPGSTTAMPAWKDRLSSTEVRYIVAWFQSLWPKETYRNWVSAQTKKSAAD